MNATTMNDFEDEPLGGADEFDRIPISSGKIQFDGLEKAAAKAERRRERRRRRNERTGKIAACILLGCIILGVILGLTLIKEAEHVLYQDSLNAETESPTISPTRAKPTFPYTPKPTVTKKPTFSITTPPPTTRVTAAPNSVRTESPTTTPAPTVAMMDTYTFEPVGDTYVELDGPHKGKAYGHDETFLVQRGDKDTTHPGQEVTIPTAVGIIQFDTSEGLPRRSQWPKSENQVQVTLRMHHIGRDDSNKYTNEVLVEDLKPVNVEIYRLPNNQDWVVESMTGEGFHKAPKAATEGFLVAQKMVQPLDTVLDIDVTSAMFSIENGAKYTDDQVLLLLKVYWEEKARPGDLFETRESEGRSPQLIFSKMI